MTGSDGQQEREATREKLLPRGRCNDPGPDDMHCSEDPGHRYSCYDASEDVSFNDGMWEDGWFNEQPHRCDYANCPGRSS